MHRLREERGIAMTTVVLLIAVLVGLAVVVVAVSLRANDASQVQRLRESAFQAADAGFNEALQCLTVLDPKAFSAGLSSCNTKMSRYAPGSPTTLAVQGRTVGSYHATVTDVTPPGSLVKKILVRSWGISPTEPQRNLRFVSAQVDLIPVGGFFDTLFSGGGTGQLTLRNNVTVNGDMYSRTVQEIKNNNVAQNVRVVGDFESKVNDSFASVWSGGSVTLENNTTVTTSVRACGDTSVNPGSAGDARLRNGAFVGSTLTLKGTFTGSNTQLGQPPPIYVPGGCAAPPSLSVPVYTYNAALYTGWTIIEFSTAALANNCLSVQTPLACNGQSLGIPPGTHGIKGANNSKGVIVRVTDPVCLTPVRFQGNRQISGNFTLISERCKLEINGTLTVPATDTDPTPRQLVLVSNSNTTSGAPDLEVTNQFDSTDARVNVLMLTPGRLEFNSPSNAVIAAGALYGGSVLVKNNLTITHGADLAANAPRGFSFDASQAVRFIPVTVLWSEEATPPLPTPGP